MCCRSPSKARRAMELFVVDAVDLRLDAGGCVAA
jgi:hypothetical protein